MDTFTWGLVVVAIQIIATALSKCCFAAHDREHGACDTDNSDDDEQQGHDEECECCGHTPHPTMRKSFSF